MLERELQDAVIEAAEFFGWRVVHFRPALTKRGWRTPVQGTYAAGFPDLVLVRDRVVFAELKTERGTLSDDQWAWASALHLAGAEHHVWTPADWTDDTVDKVLNPHRKEQAA